MENLIRQLLDECSRLNLEIRENEEKVASINRALAELQRAPAPTPHKPKEHIDNGLTTRGMDPVSHREQILERVINALHMEESVSAQQIEEATGLDIRTVSAVLRRLIRDGKAKGTGSTRARRYSAV